MFGESSGIAQGVPRKLLDKEADKFQTESLSYILSCLVGCLGDARVKWFTWLRFPPFSSYRWWGVFATCERVAFLNVQSTHCHRSYSHFGLKLTQKMLPLWLADCMFCNHRSAQPCLHTFFIVFRRFSPHRFHTFLVNMIRHPHGIHPPVLYTFVIAIFR